MKPDEKAVTITSKAVTITSMFTFSKNIGHK